MKAVRFHLVELLVIVVIVIVAFAILVPWASSEKRRRSVRESGKQIRGIHSGIMLSSSGNKDWNPGFLSDGTQSTKPMRAAPDLYGTDSVKGWEPVYRMTFLLRANFFAPQYMISPLETERKQLARAGVPITSDHFSYAMLRVNQPGTGRQGEGRNTNNSKAVAISDRNLGSTGGDGAFSIDCYTSPWRGNVVFGDNHVEFELPNILSTNYSLFATTRDDLFADDRSDAGKPTQDAAMVYQDDSTYVNQK